MNRTFVSLIALVLIGCGPGGRPSEVLDDTRVQAAIEAARQKAADSKNNLMITQIAGCTNHFSAKLFAEIGAASPGKTADSSVNNIDKPGYGAENVEGTWSFNPCIVQATSELLPDGAVCATSVTFTDQGAGRVTQNNVSQTTTGSGDVNFIYGNDVSTFIVNRNSAKGSGCSQEVVNLWTLKKIGGARFQGWVFSAILESTCPAATWKCVSFEMQP